MEPTIMCIVEGHGDVRAMPILLRRLAERYDRYDLKIPHPIRCPKSKVIREDAVYETELRRAIELATYKLESRDTGAILIVFDADESCPATLGPQLLAIAKEARPDICVGVVLAKTEFESWFLAELPAFSQAAAGSGQDPEQVRDAKGYMKHHVCENHAYSETVDQPRFTSVFDLQAAEQCRSFRKLLSVVDTVFRHVFANTP